ncbi:uncharacterized protein [Chironomus tepperi]|uniref:uncharacterized protein n=1 Tax=Chironomus tepperi TaxID=113505 RepID=UPI00391F3142
MSKPSNYSAIKDALEVYTECIKNGNEIKNLCEQCTNATVKSHPIFKKLVNKIVEDTKAIEKLKSRIDGLQKSADENDLKKWKTDLGNVINSIESASNETIIKISHAFASSGTKEIKKKFEETDKILSDTDLTQIKDEAARNFLNVLMERNRKVVECLKYAESLLPKYFKLPQTDIPRILLKKNRKLVIIGDDSSRSMSFSKNYDHLGEVIIKSLLPSRSGMSKSQSSALFKDSLNGYLIEDLDKTEVMLKLIEADNSINLMEFSRMANSTDQVKLSATIEINGEIDEDVDIVEIGVIEDYQSTKGPEAIAIVENNQTGVFNKVPIQIIPVTPEKEIHGKIIEIQPTTDEKDKTELLDEIEMPSFNSTFLEDSPMRVPHQFATPSRKDRDVRKPAMSQYYTPVRDKHGRQRLNFSSHERPVGINQIIENAAEKVVNSIMKDRSNLEDVSEIEYANMSSYYDPSQSAKHGRSNRLIETSARGNLEDVSEIEYANLSASYHPNQSARHATPQRLIETSARGNLEDVSEIEYANLSASYHPNQSARHATPQRLIETSARGNLEDVSEIEYANLSASYHPNQSVRNATMPSPQRVINTSGIRRTPNRTNISIGGNLEDVSEIEYANMSSIHEPNVSNRSRANNVSIRSPQKRAESSMRRQESRLEDISEIDYANLSSMHQSIKNRSIPVSPKSPQRLINTSMSRQGGNLEDISEIEYANLSTSFHPNESARNQVMASPQRRFDTSARGNLEDVSEIEYANMSSFYEPNQSNRSRGMNLSMTSPRRVPETSMRRQESRLEDISEIDYANLSSMHQSMRNRSIPMSPKSPQRLINTSMSRQGGNLEDVSEIEYANLSTSFNPNQSGRNQMMGSPQRRFETSTRGNLEDISEIDYADLSDMNQSIRNQTSMRSPQQRLQTSIRSRTPARQQPAEGILIDITSTPPKTPQRNVVFNDGNLMQFDNESARQSASRQSRKNENIKHLINTLSTVLNDDISSRLKRREKVHDRSLPYSQSRSVRKMLNRSIPAKMPVTSNRIVFDRPVQVVPSRIPEDLPIPMTSVVVERPREALSPLRPHEAQRINQMLLESTVNPFANNLLQVPAASRSFYEDQGNSSFGIRNKSLPLHLTPQKEKLPAMEKSFTTAWEETQRANQILNDDEDLQDITDPFSASMDDGPMNEYSAADDLQNVSQPFSDSFNEMYDSDSNLPQQLPVQSAGQFLANFDQNDNLEDVSFELEDDEKGLF